MERAAESNTKQAVEIIRLRVGDIRTSHIGDVSELLRTLGSKHTAITVAELRRSAKANRIYCAVTRQDNSFRIVGMVCLVQMFLPQGLRLWLETMVVHDSFKRRGLGRLLLSRVMKDAELLGAEHVNLTCNPTRAIAHNLYQDSGFSPANTSVLRRATRAKTTSR